METTADTEASRAVSWKPRPSSRSTSGGHAWLAFAIWLGMGLAAAAVIAWLSVTVQRAGFAPVGVFSVLVGGTIGGVAFGLARMAKMDGRRAGLVATAILALATAGGQHVVAYAQYRAGHARARAADPRLVWLGASGAPASFRRFVSVRATSVTILHWSVDAGLIVLTSTWLFALATGRPPDRKPCGHPGRSPS